MPITNYQEKETITLENKHISAIKIDDRCGIYDESNDNWIIPNIYDSIQMIPMPNTIQENDNQSFMCILENYGMSALYNISLNKNGECKIGQLIPLDNYDSINSQFFNFNKKYYIANKKESLNKDVLYIEIVKNKKMGCYIYEKIDDSKMKLISKIDCLYDDLRPSLFDAQDGLDLDSSETYSNSDCYLYEKTKHFVGNKNGVYTNIYRRLVMNESELINTIEQGFLIYKLNHTWGVLYKGEKLVHPKYSPLFYKEEVEDSDGEYKTQIRAATRSGDIYQYLFTPANWKNDLRVTKVDGDNEKLENLLDELDHMIGQKGQSE